MQSSGRPGRREANVVGYCIGGTLTASALAYMTAANDTRVASVSANKYGYWMSKAPADPEAWLGGAEFQQGSWWTDWAQWIARYRGDQVPARQPGSGEVAAIEDAPGSYVQVRAA
jgi:poly(3-hydroxyalkanoate) synthetase